ncbi:MAG: adenylate/guanylate cyclase domain-containing protein [Thermoleophilaceae bacterium]
MRLFLLVGIVATALGVAGYLTDALRPQELDTVDTRFSVRGTEEPPPELLIVAIDDVTFDELGVQFPFPRSIHADLLDRLREDGVRTVAFDVQFTEPTEPEEDGALIEAVAALEGKVVLAATEVGEMGGTRVFGGGGILDEIGARAANANTVLDEGVLRRMSFEIDGLKTFGVVAAEVAEGATISRDDVGGDTAYIDYHGPPGTIPAVSYSRALEGETPPGTFRDKIVIIGASAPSLQDNEDTSTSGDGQMSGPEIQASAISTALRDFPLQSAPGVLDIALIVLLGMVVPVGSLRLSPLRSLVLAGAVAAVFTVFTQLMFGAGLITAFLYPLGALALATFGALAVNLVTSAFEQQRLRSLFSRFVPEAVVDDVLARTDGLRLGGVQREGTVMFSDLRGFTSFAEALPVERVIDVLNRYLSEMSDAILDQGGTLVAYMGDGIMAVFGAPIEQDDHADRALAAGREMLERMHGFNGWLAEQELGDGFKMGIGLNSGPVMSGNVGSERRLEYTAIGDTTNTASRIEGMTKGTPYQLFLADSTRELLHEAPAELEDTGEHEVRGRTTGIRLWGLE